MLLLNITSTKCFSKLQKKASHYKTQKSAQVHVMSKYHIMLSLI